jgi:hypothetical protein
MGLHRESADDHVVDGVPSERFEDALGSEGSAGHRRQDHEDVAAPHRRVQPAEHADVFVVEVHVDVAVELALGGEQLVLGGRITGGEVAQDLTDVLTGGADLLLAAHRGPQNWGDPDRRHAGNDYHAARVRRAPIS